MSEKKVNIALNFSPVYALICSEQMADFAAAFFTSFLGGALMVLTSNDHGNNSTAKFFLSAAFVTVPGVIIENVSYYFFVQPCFLREHDESQDKSCKMQVIKCCRQCFTAWGFVIVLCWGLAALSLGLFTWYEVAKSRASGELPPRKLQLYSPNAGVSIESAVQQRHLYNDDRYGTFVVVSFTTYS